MPLIACPDCGMEISDSAQTCPKCARPMKPVTIEQTAKRWKALGIVGGVLMVIGIGLFLTGKTEILSGFVLLAGLGAYAFAHAAAWWTTG